VRDRRQAVDGRVLGGCYLAFVVVATRLVQFLWMQFGEGGGDALLEIFRASVGVGGSKALKIHYRVRLGEGLS
jgi:hypothetical protein